MQAVVLDSEGRLLEFQARPPTVALNNDSTAEFDWSRLFAAAGLDSSGFRMAQPDLTPNSPFDARAAWAGSAEGAQNLRVEAAAYQSRPVLFRVLGPWARLTEPPPVSFGNISTPAFVIGLLALPAVAGLLAWRNVRSGRGDRRGAFRLAGFLFLFSLFDNLAATHHVPTPAEFALLFSALRYAVALAAIGWLLYLAFEPQLRRRDPESLISWNRLLLNRLQDPVVGGHVLAGVICRPRTLLTVVRGRNYGVLGGLSLALIFNLVSVLVRRRWLRVSAFVLVTTLMLAPGYGALSFVTPSPRRCNADRALRANIDETVLLVLITEQGENRNQCEEQRNIFGFSHGLACR